MKLETRRRRRLRDNLKRAFIWAFLVLFFISCVGFLVFSVSVR